MDVPGQSAGDVTESDRPTIKVRMNRHGDRIATVDRGDGTAAKAVNAISVVCAASSGLVSLRDLPVSQVGHLLR